MPSRGLVKLLYKVCTMSPMRSYLRIGELARRTGVTEPTLRAWERRYGLLRPERSAGGFRLYSDEDALRVRAMQEHLDRGVAASEAAGLALAASPEDAPPIESLVHDLATALDSLDDVAAQAALDRALATLSVEAALRDVFLPVMADVGTGWEEDESVIAREHFATNLVRGRLLSLARGWDLGAGRRALLACAPDEQHDIGLITFGLALRARGWRVTLLGADTPIGTLGQATALTEPDLVVVSASRPQRLEHGELEELEELASAHRLAVGGPGVTQELADRLGAELLPSHPLDAAGAV
jgi:MerR family transcriptional regulator, light-induced transcriptional regulator